MGNESSLITQPIVKHKYKLFSLSFFNNSEKATAQTGLPSQLSSNRKAATVLRMSSAAT